MKDSNQDEHYLYSLDNGFWPNPDYPVEYDLSILTKKDAKKLNHITRSQQYLQATDDYPRDSKYMALVREAHKIYDKAGLTDRERRNHWIYNNALQSRSHKAYSKTPTPEGRDNKEVYVGSGRSGYRGNTVRVPRKNASKSTWAKFNKLFNK